MPGGEGAEAVSERRQPEHDDPSDDAAVELPIDGVLDLHMFQPREIRELVPDYLDECRRLGILSVRIIHGKGVGVQREIVRRILERHPAVLRFGHPGDHGSWGATVAELAPPDRAEPDDRGARPPEDEV